MKLHRLTLYRFGSFQTEQTLQFPKKPGLYFMQGINRAEPRLEANGSGKTTIWKALYWVLFGKTPEGLKAGDAANWDEGKGAYVELAFTAPGDLIHVVKRSWSPNTWTLTDLFGNVVDLTKDATNPLMAALKLEALPFLNCALMAQGEPMFLDLKAEAQATLFANVMGLDQWLGYSGNASRRASSQDLECRRLERDLAALRGKLDNLQDVDVSAKLETWEDGRRAKLKLLNEEHAALLRKLKAARASLPDLKAAHEAADEKWKQTQGLVAGLREVASKETDKERDLAAQLRGADLQRDLLLNQLDDIAKKGTCPTCGQEFKHGQHDKHLDELGYAAKRFKEQGRELYGKLQSLRQRISNVEQVLRKAELDEQKAQGVSLGAELDKRTLENDLARLDRDLDQLEDESEALEKQENPYLSVQRDQGSTRGRILQQVRQAERLLQDAEERYAIYSYWVRGFKEVRLQLIAEALDELEIEVNNSVTELGLVNWELQFDVDRETKGGSIAKGFSVCVTSPHNRRAVPWAAWSGGERQRLRIAAQMGLANLIRNRTGASLTLEVWDEPTQGMSAQGVGDLLHCLKQRAVREQRQIWIVDHHVLNYGGFDGVCTVTKTSRKGSTIDWV